MLQITWFTAFMALDQQRMAANRNGIFPCFVHKNPAPARDWFFGLNVEKMVLGVYEKLLPNWFFKAAVLGATAAFLGIGIWGTAIIRQEFDPLLLLPPASYLRRFADRNHVEYPSNGWDADVYTGPLDYTDMAAMEQMTAGLQGLVDNRTHLLNIDPWWPPLKEFAVYKKNFTRWQDFVNPTDFPIVLSDFLFSNDGANYKADFKLNGSLICREPAPAILATRFGIKYRLMSGPEEHIPAKRAVEAIIKEAAASDRAFSHVKVNE
jgi:hypothetical protein